MPRPSQGVRGFALLETTQVCVALTRLKSLRHGCVQTMIPMGRHSPQNVPLVHQRLPDDVPCRRGRTRGHVMQADAAIPNKAYDFHHDVCPHGRGVK